MRWLRIGKQQLGLHIQPKKYWFGVPKCPAWAFKRLKSKIRLNLIIAGKIQLIFIQH